MVPKRKTTGAAAARNATQSQRAASSPPVGSAEDHEQRPSVPHGSLCQRLLWPPITSPDDRVGIRVDIVQATRLTNHIIPLPLGCGVAYIDSGILFDPAMYPDLSRKTQEKLATQIIESGRSLEHGKTIKVKEYSSKARKRIRFACSREECNVTFQINWDSNRGHWFMKRNKGNFEHTCPALLKSTTQQQQHQPHGAICHPVHYAPVAYPVPHYTNPQAAISGPPTSSPPPPLPPRFPVARRSSSLSAKRTSPDPSEEVMVSTKRSKILASTAKTVTEEDRKPSPEMERSVRSVPGNKAAKECDNIDTPTMRNTRTRKMKSVPGLTSSCTPPLVSEKPKTSLLFCASDPLTTLIPAASLEEKARDAKPAKGPGPSPSSSVAVSIYSQEPVPKYHAKVASHLDDFFWSAPPSPLEVVTSRASKQEEPHLCAMVQVDQAAASLVSGIHYDEEMANAEHQEPFHLAKRKEEPNGGEEPPVDLGPFIAPSSSSSAHAALLVEEFHDIDYSIGPDLAGPDSGLEESFAAGEAASGVPAPETRESQNFQGPTEECLIHELSLCSLLVSPLDLVNIDGWDKHTNIKPQDNKNNSMGEEGDDDNSSISTNWSAMDFKPTSGDLHGE